MELGFVGRVGVRVFEIQGSVSRQKEKVGGKSTEMEPQMLRRRKASVKLRMFFSTFSIIIITGSSSALF